MANAYACVEPVANDVRVQGQCSVGMVETNPTLVVFSTDIPDASALVGVFLLGFAVNCGGPQVTAYIINRVLKLIYKL